MARGTSRRVRWRRSRDHASSSAPAWLINSISAPRIAARPNPPLVGIVHSKFHSFVVHSNFTPLRCGLLVRWRKLLNSIDLDSTPWTPCTLFSIDVYIPKQDVTG